MLLELEKPLTLEKHTHSYVSHSHTCSPAGHFRVFVFSLHIPATGPRNQRSHSSQKGHIRVSRADF